jgi:hypothetical protein
MFNATVEPLQKEFEFRQLSLIDSKRFADLSLGKLNVARKILPNIRDNLAQRVS